MKESARTLSEFESKQTLQAYDVPTSRERLAASADDAARAAAEIGFPVVLKLCGRRIAHKTERDLVRLALVDEAAVRAAAEDLLARARADDGDVAIRLGVGDGLFEHVVEHHGVGVKQQNVPATGVGVARRVSRPRRRHRAGAFSYFSPL